MDETTLRVIGTLGRHTLVARTDESVEPGHQQIGVTPDDVEGVSLLFALTGNIGALYGWIQPVRLPDGRTVTFSPHDEAADLRLVQLVDLCADLRFTAPEMIQLRIEAVEND